VARLAFALLCASAILATSCGRSINAKQAPIHTADQPTYTTLETANYAVESTYRQFWIVIAFLDREPPERWHGILAAVATQPELGRQLQAAINRHQAQTPYSEPTIHIEAIRGAFSTGAHVQDCQRAAADLPRRSVIATLTRPTQYSNWRVSNVTYRPGTC
jgi:hypothetical protein